MRMSVAEAAKMMDKSQQFVRIGLQRNRLPFGTAVQNDSGRWSYHISPNKFFEYMGINADDQIAEERRATA